MSTALSLTPPLAPIRDALADTVAARVAVYLTPGEPPQVEELRDEPVALIEGVCDLVADRSDLPAPAVREIVENLIHADFRDAVVSILDGGHTVRVGDHGPGIDDPARALTPGFTAAGAAARAVVRGVGGGLPLADEMMAAAGGRLDIERNLGGGTVVTLALPRPAESPASEPVCSDASRVILALLLEVGSAGAERLSVELGRSRAECGRELALLQHRGLVARETGGACRLTDAGTALVASLF
ncbi:MAG: ATP-binding protein [Thermoleophilia bacterium]